MSKLQEQKNAERRERRKAEKASKTAAKAAKPNMKAELQIVKQEESPVATSTTPIAASQAVAASATEDQSVAAAESEGMPPANSDVVSETVAECDAALVALEHGDPKPALDLLAEVTSSGEVDQATIDLVDAIVDQPAPVAEKSEAAVLSPLDASPKTVCRKCGAAEASELQRTVSPHNGGSLRRIWKRCNKCGQVRVDRELVQA